MTRGGCVRQLQIQPPTCRNINSLLYRHGYSIANK
jgi:hypothetical protein